MKELEAEEDELLKMEGVTEMLTKDEVIEGVATSELRNVLKEVRNKKALKKLEHKLKAKNTKHQRQHNIEDVIENFASKGVDVNKEALRSHSKTRKTIKDLEDNQEKRAKKALGLGSSDDSDAGSDLISDEEMRDEEAKLRGRKRSRTRSPNDLMMEVDEEDGVAKTAGGRSMTPA